MSAPKGNQFWKLRSEHGRDKIFKNAQQMWEAACEYFDWCEENPFKKVEQSRGGRGKKDVEVDKEGMREVDTGLVELPQMRPFTLEGVCHYMDVNTGYFNDFERNLKTNKKLSVKEVQDFSAVITRIREVIKRQKFEGAASGFFQQNIIARDLGLSDKKELDHTSKGEPITGMKIINEPPKND